MTASRALPVNSRRASAEVDDHAGGVEHDTADMADEHGGEDIDGVDLMTGDRFAAPLIDRRRVERFDVDAGGAVRGGVRRWFGRR